MTSAAIHANCNVNFASKVHHLLHCDEILVWLFRFELRFYFRSNDNSQSIPSSSSSAQTSDKSASLKLNAQIMEDSPGKGVESQPDPVSSIMEEKRMHKLASDNFTGKLCKILQIR